MIPDGIITISSIEAFNKIVNNYRNNLILVDFFADWCIPCKTFLPIYKKLQRKYYEKQVIFTRINIDQFPEVADQFNVKGVPTLLAIKNKKGLKKEVGALRASDLQNLIETYL